MVSALFDTLSLSVPVSQSYDAFWDEVEDAAYPDYGVCDCT